MAVARENLAIDRNLTRQEITTFLNHTVNLGCYVTNVTEPTNSSQSLSSPVTSELVVYTWKKDNVTVTQSSRAKIHGNVLVVTPESPKDFGMYECNVTNGVSSIQCRILLIKGLKYELAGGKGCVNISVLMPVLAVAVLFALFFVHLVIKRKEPKILTQKRRKSEQRRKSRKLLYNRFNDEKANSNEKKQDIVSTEMQVINDYTSAPKPQEPEPKPKPSEEHRREQRSGFSYKSFRELSIELDDAETASLVSDESKTSNDKNGFYDKIFKTDSIDESDDEDLSQTTEEAVAVLLLKEGKGKVKFFR
ncbi:hypothetical protein ABFA07_013325 [Porites harrisoni]